MATGRMAFTGKETRLPALGAAALFAVAAADAGPPQKLEDVQIGERGDILRVALICSARCDIVAGDGLEFRIEGVAARLDIDLSGRSALAERLTIASKDGASVVALEARTRINAARVVDCLSDSGEAPCIEYRFAPTSDEANGAAPAARQEKAPPIREDGARPEAAADKKELPFIGAVILAPRPTLRDAPAEGLLYLPQFSPPERLAPPKTASDADKSAATVPENVDVGRPAYIAVDRAKTLGRGAAFDLKGEAAEILGKSMGAEACATARTRLQEDAWALDAMIDFAFCKAGEGKLDEADADFARLLAYTPDNYEALVGRGLIAFARGERERGHDFLQSALDAPPPIAESDRIVAAMERN